MKRKRWIAAFLSLVMILTMVSPVSAKGFSKDSNSSGDKYSWSQTKEESPNDKKETSQDTACLPMKRLQKKQQLQMKLM